MKHCTAIRFSVVTMALLGQVSHLAAAASLDAFDDAVAAAEALDIALTKRGKHDGQDIPIGKFVEEIVSGGILGMVNSLKGVDDPEKVEITLTIE